MNRLLITTVMVLLSSPAFAQAPASAPPPPSRTSAPAVNAGLGTPAGHEVNVSLAGYTYGEPSNLSITIHGPKVGGEYRHVLAEPAHALVRAGECPWNPRSGPV